MTMYAIMNGNVCTGSTSKQIEGALVYEGYGLIWNGTTWDDAPILPVAPIRSITKRQFMKRIDQADRILIRKSTDDIVIDIHEDLKIATSVDLDDQDVIDAIAYLSSQSLLLNTDIDNLRADGD